MKENGAAALLNADRLYFCGMSLGGIFMPHLLLYSIDVRNNWTGGNMMTKIFITLTGTKYYFGSDFLKKGDRLKLTKEPDNKYDKEAILVSYEGFGKIGYVANSSHTVIGESVSAGRLYDRIRDTAFAKVMSVTPLGTICKICKKSLVSYEK